MDTTVDRAPIGGSSEGTYRIDGRDAIRFHWHLVRHEWHARRVYINRALWSLGTALVLGWLYAANWGMTRGVVVGVVAFLAGFLGDSWWMLRRIRKGYTAGRHGERDHVHQFAFDPTGMEVVCSASRSHIGWPDITGIGEDRHDLYIMIAPCNGALTPKRAFPDAATAADAAAFVRAKTGRVQPAQDPATI